MKMITCASYYGSGSSAVTDLLMEYRSVASLGSEFECRIAQDMFGLSDLEYYLVENQHRHNSGFALKQFRYLMDLYGLDTHIRMENYPKYLGRSFEEAVDHYLTALTDLTYQGGTYLDTYWMGNWEIIALKLWTKGLREWWKLKDLVKAGKKRKSALDTAYLNRRIQPKERISRKQTSYISVPGENFLPLTRKFTSEMFSGCQKKGKELLFVDQLVPVSNSMRYVNYFDDIKVVCVDRDPRDLYLLEKDYWHGCVIPREAEEFVKWFQLTRAHRKTENDDSKKILRIQLEDLIYNYEDTVEKIEQFSGLRHQDHTEIRTHFDPAVSIQNTRLWKKHPERKQEIAAIEKGLAEYCTLTEKTIH